VLALTLAVLLSQNATDLPSLADRSYLERVDDVTTQPRFYNRFFGDVFGGTLVAAPMAFVVGKELDGCKGGDNCLALGLLTAGLGPVLIAGGEAFGHWLSGGRGSFASALKGVLIGVIPALAVALISYATMSHDERPEAVDYVMLPAAGLVTAFTASWFVEVDHSDKVGWR